MYWKVTRLETTAMSAIDIELAREEFAAGIAIQVAEGFGHGVAQHGVDLTLVGRDVAQLGMHEHLVEQRPHDVAEHRARVLLQRRGPARARAPPVG